MCLFISCKQAPKKSNLEWINIFDGTSLNGWRAYNGDKMPPGWMIIDSVLTFTTDQIMEEDANKAHHELDLWTKETRKLKLKKFGSDALDLREKA